jgi:hypothetical protein
MAEAGRTRVRRFVTEREVAKDVTLHEEHAEKRSLIQSTSARSTGQIRRSR